MNHETWSKRIQQPWQVTLYVGQLLWCLKLMERQCELHMSKHVGQNNAKKVVPHTKCIALPHSIFKTGIRWRRGGCGRDHQQRLVIQLLQQRILLFTSPFTSVFFPHISHRWHNWHVPDRLSVRSHVVQFFPAAMFGGYLGTGTHCFGTAHSLLRLQASCRNWPRPGPAHSWKSSWRAHRSPGAARALAGRLPRWNGDLGGKSSWDLIIPYKRI